MELEKSTTVIIIIVAIGLILGIGLFVLGQFQTTVFTNSTATPTSNIVLTASTDTLDPLGIGITTSEVKANNQTWLEFDGVNDFLNNTLLISNKYNLDEGESVSFSLWMKTNASDAGRIISKRHDGSNTEDGYFLRLESNGKFRTYVGNGSAGYSNGSIGASTYNDDNWHHLVLIIDRTNNLKQLYINNNLTSNISFDLNGAISNGFSLCYGGSDSCTLGFFNGSLDSITSYNYPLSEEQVSNLYFGGFDYSESKFLYNRSEISFDYLRPFYFNSTGTLYSYNMNNNSVVKSDDLFVTFEQVHQFADGETPNKSRSLFIDSRDTIFLARRNTGKLHMSYGNDTNWTTPLTIKTGGGGTFWGIDEDNDGNLFVGSYAEAPAKVWKSINGGVNWTIVYNESEDLGGEGCQHIHNVKFNPYDNCTYIAMGDNIACSKIAKTCDSGTTWAVVNNDSNQAGHVIAMEFTETYSIFGTDNHGISNQFNGIWRMRTDTVGDFETLLYFNDTNLGWSSVSDEIGNIYFGLVSGGNNKVSELLLTTDEGDTWNILDTYLGNDWTGFAYISNFYENKSIYVKGNENETVDNQNFLFYGFNDTTLKSLIKLNENTGTTTYDTSGNSNDGTISGATWATDGIFNTLTAITDYTISTTTGLFTITNSDYVWSWMNVSYSYSAITDSTGYDSMTTVRTGLATFADWIAIIVVVIAAAIVLGIILLNFGGRRNRI